MDQPQDARATVTGTADGVELQYSVTFQNTNRQDQFAGDVVSLASPCDCDLEPFGRLAFPYEKGDYALDGLFRLIWPGYEDCSYLRNERGFLTPTPFGDIFDVVTNRCPAEVLGQYSAVILMGDVEMTPTLVGNLNTFAQQGGDVLLSAEQAQALPDSVHGLRFGQMRPGLLSRDRASSQVWDEQPYSYQELTCRSAVPLLERQRRSAANHQLG